MRATFWALLAVGGVIGCGGLPDEDLGELRQATITRNWLTRNGLLANGLVGGGASRFTRSGLDGQRITSSRPSDTLAFLDYAVRCALPTGASATLIVNGASTRFVGEIGLAASWRTHACDGTCQQWVSACLLARTNYYGEQVPLSMRGPHPSLSSGLLERATYSMQEGAFYGNLFTSPMHLNACMGGIFDSASIGDALVYLQRRVCAGESFDLCPIQVVGPCRDFLLPPWTLSVERACTTSDDAGAFGGCHDRLGTPKFPAGAGTFPAATTFLDPLTPVSWLPLL